MKKKHLFWDKKSDRELLVQSLRRGEVALGTSDTVLGLMASISQEGFDHLNAIKTRSEKPYIILLPSLDALGNFVEFPLQHDLRKLLDACWPGPLTVIFKARTDLPAWMQSKQGTVALRVPDHPGLQAVALSLGGIFSTSANVHGKPVAKTIADVQPEILEKISLIVSDRNVGVSMVPSTMVDCSGPKITLVREGAYSRAELEKIYGKPLR